MISVTEIVLIIVGFAAVVLGFLLPAGKNAEVDPEKIDEMVQDKLDKALNDSVRRSIDGMAQDSVAAAIDDNRLDLSRITNDKVMEISEYAETVLDDIKKNHDEVVFMYDMLNDKHKNLTNTVTEITKTAENAKQTVRDAELTARDARDAIATLDAAAARAKVAESARAEARLAAKAAQAVPAPAAAETFKTIRPEAQANDAAAREPGQIREITVGRPADAADDPGVAPEFHAFEAVVPGNEGSSEQVRTANTPSVAKTVVNRGRTSEPSSQNKQILEMHNAGKSNMVIARELGLGIGEVRLVIDLSKKQLRTGEG